MKLQLTHNKITYTCDTKNPIDISIPIGQVKCFYAKDYVVRPYIAGDFIGAVKEGAPINFFEVQMNPHGHGTHTECIGHITEKQESINEQLKQFHFIAQLVSVPISMTENGDRLITKETLQKACPPNLPEAIVIRTVPNTPKKTSMNYSGKNPPYLETAAMEFLVQQNIKHLLLDLPSVDKEEDGGQLLNHRLFWNVENKAAKDHTRIDCTITELIYVPNNIVDGLYLLNIQIPSMHLDAAPSKPILYMLN